LILPNWYPEDQLSFTVLQYHGLDEQQVKTKLSQFPRGTKLFFQMYKSGQIFPLHHGKTGIRVPEFAQSRLSIRRNHRKTDRPLAAQKFSVV
jgi:hypothetical protein